MLNRRLRPVITDEGGVCWVPIACLVMEKTIVSFVKLLSIITINGIKDKLPKTKMSNTGLSVRLEKFKIICSFCTLNLV